jgi:LysM repeat protein
MDTNNSRTSPGSSTLPAITLTVLVALIVALLYVGYEYVADSTGGAEELTNMALDTTTRTLANQSDPEFINPLDSLSDTTSTPIPVDLSQSKTPVEEPANDAVVEDVAVDNREKTEGKPSPEELKKPEPVAEKAVEKPKPTPAETKPAETKPVEKVAVNPGGVSSSHTVDAGETFYGIANRYNMKISTLKELNPDVTEDQVKSGVTKLKVKAMAVHTVGPGDLLRVVAQKYGVSKEALMRANGKTKDLATRGERLIIPYPEKQ